MHWSNQMSIKRYLIIMLSRKAINGVAMKNLIKFRIASDEIWYQSKNDSFLLALRIILSNVNSRKDENFSLKRPKK
jgi:hypothetical protein|tara:strand:+ start:144 stop:371 length:228 start_codon:yes stop_codon:yes gene_type:complete